jgi:hypothetical protein
MRERHTEKQEKHADMIVIDNLPIMVMTDAIVLRQHVDGIM